MAINEQGQQLDVAREAEELLRTLAHSTRDVPNPRDSYSMLGELGAIIDHVAQVCEQLSSWHNRVEGGTHYEGEDGGTEGSARAASAELTTAAGALRLASNHVGRAHSHNAVVRWYPEPR
ncbi:hypothetical protein D9V34_17320 [Mycetocola lacteus]|uniref:Uncharacterized protein n=1 Tax=Mycetocola lacteus TaxID=76637 RepID=A0A3L7AEY7_9MICO|nr:hypothetical protein [Mycetocola lacteus]RLP78575.1 hypothetical protein D9V34_17320 [Mycetocola lacteus]